MEASSPPAAAASSRATRHSTDDPLNTWRAYVVRVTEAGTVLWQESYGSPHANNAAEFVLPTRDGGFAVFADSDEHGPGWSNFALYKLAGDPAAADAKP